MTFASDTYFKKGVNIQVFIGLMQRNFILTDMMKTGFDQDVRSFVESNTMADQEIDLTGQYYDLPLFDLSSYDRKFALIDCRYDNTSISNNHEFHMEYMRRSAKLKKLGFTFIQSSPWECVESGTYRMRPTTDHLDLHKWWGDASWWWWYCARKHRGTPLHFDHDHKRFDFLYLNKMRKKHRELLWHELRKDDLLENSLYTFHGLEPKLKLPPEYELPWVDRNNYPQSGFDQDVFEKPYNDCAVNMVSETSVGCEFITEKVYKPLMAGQIFVVYGYKGILAKLRAMGFQTYGEHIDESYDDEPNSDKRVAMISDTLHKVKGTDYNKLYKDSQDIRTHNQKIFFDEAMLGKEINRTLRLWFEFADGSQVPSRES
tara:strand:- start:118 stop:1236 length:1119 start_codon:yes stop_codon:yes gene_type:complete